MIAVSRVFVILALLYPFKASFAQSLTERLSGEDSIKLAEEARSRGDIVRGAILFHQGNINCAKCHRSTSEAARLGPDLSKLGEEASDTHLVESILQPSKQIKEGFETVSVLTLDGRLINGLVVSEDATKIELRDRQDVDQLITIEREDIDEIQKSKMSLMPDKLADELKSRQQFLDLLRYVIDIKERGPNAKESSSGGNERRIFEPELSGLVVVAQFNCVACHRVENDSFPIANKTAPRLKWSAQHLNPAYVRRFVENPHATKPGTKMPDLLGQLDEDDRKKTADAITQYILSKSKNEYAAFQVDPEAAARGSRVFHSVGCVACHSPRDDNANEIPMSDAIVLGNISNKYDVKGLVKFLENPMSARPSGHMPNMQLSHREAIDISHYLLQAASVSDAKSGIESNMVKLGEEFFAKYHCASCHTEISNTKTLDNNDTSATHTAFDKLDPGKGCLSGAAGDWPRFQLSEEQSQQIRSMLESYPSKLTAQQTIDVSLEHFNCTACHDRANLGGVAADRNHHFQTTNMNLGDQGRIPPTLTGVGAKLKADWMRDVMVNGTTVRPYMNTRMPQYGEKNIGHLIELFQAQDTLGNTEFAKFDDQKKTREYGHQLVGNKGLNCVACHTFQYKQADTMPAVDLTEMSRRLKKDWFYQYMLAPQKFSPNTVMPSFWPRGVAIRKDLEGEPDYQIEAIWQYLLDGRQARMPSGVVRKPLEIVVANEAQILRRKYPDIGKRGIGVGYPGGVNIAYDAEQMRLGLIWKGKFADPSGVWRGQGSGQVRPMGQTISFDKGPELDFKEERWVVDDGRPPNHRFKGYVLDDARRPTFQYTIGDMTVSDFFQETVGASNDETFLRRTITINSKTNETDVEEKTLSFRVASSNKIEDQQNGVYRINDRLTVRFGLEREPLIVSKEAGGEQLEIPIKVTPDDEIQIVIDYSWDR